MNIRFYNAQILPMNGNMDIIHGEVWVEGNTITYVGPHKECGNVWDREIDAEKNLIMPGFKNAHTHTAMTFLRSYADDMPLQDWLTKQIFPMEAKLQPDDIYWLSKLGIMEYLTSGITSCFDMYLNTEMMAKASVECGFRSVLVSGINDFSSSLEEVEADFNTYNQYDELIRYCLGFHAEYTCSEELLKKIAELSQRYKAPVFAHMSETEREVAECVQRHGTTPAAYLDSLGLFEHGGGGYHCIWFTDEEIERMIAINLVAPIKLLRGFTGSMKQKKYGRIVNIGSIWAVVSKGGRCVYSATKNGIHGVTNTLAVELAADNILVNTVCPGFTMTELTVKNNTPEEIAQISANIPMQRMAKPEEIAEVVYFLCSEQNTYLTGQKITVDGGYTER